MSIEATKIGTTTTSTITAAGADIAEKRRVWIEGAIPVVMEQVGEFTTDDLHSLVWEPMELNWWGVLMLKLRTEKRVDHCGFVRSKRRTANGRFVQVWRVRR